MTITTEQYFAKPHSTDQLMAAQSLLVRVNALLEEARGAAAWDASADPDTGCQISGSRGGDGDGGFRTPMSRTGAPLSAHREAKAVDVHDDADTLDSWLSTFDDGHGGNSKLEQYGLYREAPGSTPGWAHLTTRAPGSGHRTYIP